MANEWQLRYNFLNLSSLICETGELIMPALTSSQDSPEIAMRHCPGAIQVLAVDASKLVFSLH